MKDLRYGMWLVWQVLSHNHGSGIADDENQSPLTPGRNAHAPCCMRVTGSEFAAGYFTTETQFPEDHVAWTDPGNAGEQQGDGGNIKQPVNLVEAGQPDAQGDKGRHEDKQHSDRAHIKNLLYDSLLVACFACGYGATMPIAACSCMDA
jgi:hypothetical protein